MKKPQKFYDPTQKELSRTGHGTLYGSDRLPVITPKHKGPRHRKKKKKS